MRKFILFILMLLFVLTSSQAQNLEKVYHNQVGIGFGYQGNYLKDSNLSPLNQVGGGFATSLKYQRVSKNIFGANVQFSSGSVKSGPSNHFLTSYINANLGFEYLFKLSPDESAYQFYLGPVYNTRVLFLDWYDLDAFSYAATHGVGIKGRVSKKIKEKHLVHATLSLPVFQFLARPPYNGIDEFIIENQDSPAKILLTGQASSWNNFAAVEFGLNYQYKLTKHLDWEVNYTLFAQKVSAPNTLKSFSNTLTTGAAISF